mgnify:FL=1
MKIGTEVEGTLRGLKTLFCQASELQSALTHWEKLQPIHKLQALYVSDHENVLTENEFQRLAKFTSMGSCPTVTVENLTGRRIEDYRVGFMLAVQTDPRSMGFFPWPGTVKLDKHDQIKFTFDRFVATAEVRDFDITTPEEFNGDIEIDLDTLKGAE